LEQVGTVTDPLFAKRRRRVADEPKAALVEMSARPPRAGLNTFEFFAAYRVRVESLSPVHQGGGAGCPLRKKRTQGRPPPRYRTIRGLRPPSCTCAPLFLYRAQACPAGFADPDALPGALGVYSAWVFGVKTDPFYAHAGCQQATFFLCVVTTPKCTKAFHDFWSFTNVKKQVLFRNALGGHDDDAAARGRRAPTH